MDKGKFLCPFTNATCHECVLYRGRHCFIDNHLKEKAQHSRPVDIKADFQALDEALQPQIDDGARTGDMPQIALRVVDVENGTSEVHSLEEARQWDWRDEQTIRLIDGRHLRSWDDLIEMMTHKAAKGYPEVKLYVAPRFMVLAGG
jgi:hypothetical protein